MESCPRYAIFFSAGLGDALLMIPLLKALKKRKISTTGIQTSPHVPVEYLTFLGLIDEWVDLRTTPLKTCLGKIGRFQCAFLNQFATGKKNILYAKLMSREVSAIRIDQKFSFFNLFVSQLIVPKADIHDGQQNLRAFFGSQKIDHADFECEGSIPSIQPKLANHYITLQLSTGNDQHRYKNWPQKNWSELIARIHEKFPDYAVVLLGDANEKHYVASTFNVAKNSYLIDRVGQTSLMEAAAWIKGSKLFVGLDGGLMHLSVSLGKPSVTIWGASNPVLYGYAQFNPQKHVVVHSKLSCSPCNAWINPNRTKTSNPAKCPDFACMSAISVNPVFNAIKSILEPAC